MAEALIPREPYWCKATPNVPRVWSASSISTIAECPRKFELSYVEGWRGKGENLDILFGTYFHDGMFCYVTARIHGESPADALDAAIQIAWANPLPAPSRPSQVGKTHIGLARALVEYTDKYFGPEFDLSNIVLIDGMPALEVPFSFAIPRINADGEHYIVRGFIDLIRTFIGMYTAVDYKTTSRSLSEWYFKDFEINFQNYIYSVACRILTEHTVTQFLIDAVEVQKTGGVNCARQPIQLNPGEIEEGMKDVEYWIRMAEIFAEQGYYPKNPSSCKFCDFNQVCNKDPVVRINHLQSDFEEKRREFADE